MTSCLPESMAPFVAAIGESATLSIVRVFGGGRIYVPRPERLDDAHPLVRLLGRPLAARLAHALGGESHDVATANSVEATIRADEIRRRFRGGASVRQLALSFGISTRTVWRVIRCGAPDVTPDNTTARRHHLQP